MGGASCITTLLACGPTVSLDADVPHASSSSDTTDSSGATDSSDTTGSTSTSASTTDEPPVDLPPPLPGECAPGCEVDLPVTWTWEDATGLDPQQTLSAMLPMPDGGWVVATSSTGLSHLTKITAEGELSWSVPADLSCNCEIVDLALYPSGQLAVLGQGSFDSFYQVLMLGRFDLEAGDFAWKIWDTIYGTNLVPPRVGSVIPIDETHTVVLVVEAVDFSRWSSEEWVEVYSFENDLGVGYYVVDSEIVDAASPAPRGLRLDDGSVAVALPNAADASSYMLWLETESFMPFDAAIAPGLPEAMARGPDDALLIAGHLDISPQQVVLQTSGLARGEQPWLFSDGMLSTTSSAPALAVDSAGSAIVAMLATAGTPDDPRGGAIELTGLHQGTVVWSTSIPLALHPSSHPVAIDATDDGGLVLAGIVDGRLHLERREQGCRCD